MNKVENRKSAPAPELKEGRRPLKPSTPAVAASQVEPGELAKWINKAKELPGVREDLVARVRAEIEAGTYETPEKLDLAARKLLEEMLGE